ncbi:MAG: metallophosphoesterase [Candidatus Eremiobacteraeota bacterium]|nr:metallophosphoesterase [Candidatus Eremiobacteraeota bacterium]MBV8366797.1 metallophosphoesterase [Candidatus Eremiobacteraeota bacterium]
MKHASWKVAALGAFAFSVLLLRAGTPPVAAAAADPVIAAAGDIACDLLPTAATPDPDERGTEVCHMAATAALIKALRPAAVLALGDEQYADGRLDQFQAGYDKSWGAFKDITHPAPGNHEYHTPGAAGYYGYFGASAGDPAKGYYSFELGGWHLISLNGNCKAVGGCAADSPQTAWLVKDLAAHRAACTLAYWHQPRFSSGAVHGNDPAYDAFWRALYAAHADVVLNGHDHEYERFAPQTPDAMADAKGITEFVVGTGGRSHYHFAQVQPNSKATNATAFGVLALTLHPHGFDWRFIAEPGSTFTDAGSQGCHG